MASKKKKKRNMVRRRCGEWWWYVGKWRSFFQYVLTFFDGYLKIALKVPTILPKIKMLKIPSHRTQTSMESNPKCSPEPIRAPNSPKKKKKKIY